MSLSRRQFVQAALAGPALALDLPARAEARRVAPIQAVALDGFTTFDPRPVAALAERLFPGQGAALTTAWRTRQFEYSWLRNSMDRYVDFWQVTEEALVFAARQTRLELDGTRRRQLMQAFLALDAWPDARPALERLHASGIRLAFLSNFTVEMLDAASRNAGLAGLLEPHLSTDRVGVFKPHPRAYRMGVEAFGLPPEAIAFAAFGGWDAAGAKAFGYPTFWVNRLGLPVEQLGVKPDDIGASLEDLVRFVSTSNAASRPAA